MQGNLKVKIEKAKTSDFLNIAGLDRQVWPDKKIADGEHLWRHFVEDGLVFVARIENNIVGAVVCFNTYQNFSWLHKLFVERQNRQQGIATALMQKVLTYADASRLTLKLTVSPENRQAIELYRKYNFKEQKIVEDYYGNSQSRIVMKRSQ